MKAHVTQLYVLAHKVGRDGPFVDDELLTCTLNMIP